jgi:RNA polymerase sigma-70 factor, ECF subfamily
MKKEMSIQEIANSWIATKSDKVFKQLVSRLTPGLVKHISGIETNYEKRKDIINSTFADVYQKTDNFYNASKGAFSSWVYKVAMNNARLSKRHDYRNYSLDELQEIGSSAITNNKSLIVDFDFDNTKENKELATEELFRLVIDFLRTETESDGKHSVWTEVLSMREIDGLSFNEIAKTLNMNDATVRGVARKARKYVGDELMKRNPEIVKKYMELYSYEN